MSNSGVNTGFAKCFILFMAVIILLQGAVYLGLSIWGITLRECSKDTTDISNNPFQFAMDTVYFLNEECGSPSVTISSVPVTLNVNWNAAEPVVDRTYIFMICYAVISALWIVTSLAVITTICGPVTKTVNAICFWPWFLSIMAGSILDAVATGYHIHDIFNTTSVDKTFAYMGISTTDQVMEVLRNFDAYFITPAVVMTCVSSRVVLIWFLNIFGSSFCISLSNVLSKRNSSKQSSVNSLATTSTAPITTPQQQPPRQEFQQQPPQLYIPQQQQQQPEPMLIRPKPLQIQNVTSVQRQSSVPPQNNRPYDLQSPVAPVVAASIYPSAPSPNESQGEPITYRNTETHPDRLNYPSQSQQPPPPAQQQKQVQQEQQRPLSPYNQELSVVSPLNNRYSTSNPAQNPRVSEELRGQLPWSYTSMPPPVPKKPQLKTYPEIPAADYDN